MDDIWLLLDGLRVGADGRVPAASLASYVWVSSHRLISVVVSGVRSIDQYTLPPS